MEQNLQLLFAPPNSAVCSLRRFFSPSNQQSWAIRGPTASTDYCGINLLPSSAQGLMVSPLGFYLSPPHNILRKKNLWKKYCVDTPSSHSKPSVYTIQVWRKAKRISTALMYRRTLWSIDGVSTNTIGLQHLTPLCPIVLHKYHLMAKALGCEGFKVEGFRLEYCMIGVDWSSP